MWAYKHGSEARSNAFLHMFLQALLVVKLAVAVGTPQEWVIQCTTPAQAATANHRKRCHTAIFGGGQGLAQLALQRQ